MKKIVLILIGIELLFSCNLNMGSDPDSYDKSSAGGDEIDYEDEYRTAVIQETLALTEGSTPEEAYNAGTAILAAKNSNSIDTVRAVEIIEEEIPAGEQRDLLINVVIDNYTLQDVQSAMNGVADDPEAGIEAALSFDENIDEDSTAQLNGDVEWTDGISGSGLRFDSEGEYVSLPDSENLDLTGEEASIEVWIYPENNIAAAGIIHKGTATDFSDESYSLQYNSPGQVAMIFTNESGTATYVISNEPVLAENQWHHIVIAWNMSEVHMYIDGAEVMQLKYYQNGWKSSLPADFAPIRDSDGDLMIGSQPVSGYRFEGIIDNPVLYNRMLTAGEAADNYQALIY
ncbi:MAG: LamG domain-containing protein [Spirochaetota bacterium]|nr:LamG domain-containing protein [Spirochaetota bacterium]